MSTKEKGTTIVVEIVDKNTLSEESRADVDDKIVTVKNGENTMTLLQPNVLVEGEFLLVREPGLKEAKLPLAVLDGELLVSALDTKTQSTIFRWITTRYGYSLGLEKFPDIKRS